jgi:hypothetical protein
MTFSVLGRLIRVRRLVVTERRLTRVVRRVVVVSIPLPGRDSPRPPLN